MILYQIGDQWGDGTHPEIMDRMIADGWLVPVEPCEHGNYAEHIVSVHVWAGVPTWCPGAGIGDTE